MIDVYGFRGFLILFFHPRRFSVLCLRLTFSLNDRHSREVEELRRRRRRRVIRGVGN